MDIIGRKFYFIVFSGLLILISIFFIAFFGLKQGIDLAGGANWQLRFAEIKFTKTELADFLSGLVKQNVVIRKIDDVSFNIRLPNLSEADHQNYFLKLKDRFGAVEEISFESIGPSIGKELKDKSLRAAFMVLFGIALYVGWAFRKVSRPVSSWKYGFIVLITLAHDVIIPIGLLAFLGWRFAVEIDTNFIVALLVIMGFSVHDTIVVFDRIRENLIINKQNLKKFENVINLSVNETMVRSINTSLTLALALITLMIWGPPVLFYFVLTILIGVIFGTYSSIFIASPLLTFFKTSER